MAIASVPVDIEIPSEPTAGMVGGRPALFQSDHGTAGFDAIQAATGHALPGRFVDADKHMVDDAACRAAAAFPDFASASDARRGELLCGIAKVLRDNRQIVLDRCEQETGYESPRVAGEFERAAGQLELFAELAHRRAWDHGNHDPAQPDRHPLPRPSMRRRMVPVGPVAVFGACNFPLAISVLGNDLVAAFASGNPVIVKSHPGHVGTCELLGRIVAEAVRRSAFSPDIFSILHGLDHDTSRHLVSNDAIAAVGFTGSPGGGKAIAKVALERQRPIPVYAELGSPNPVFVTDAAMGRRGDAIADGFVQSLRFGNGHMCTKPGVLIMSRAAADSLSDRLLPRLNRWEPLPMLSHRIAADFDEATERLGKLSGIASLSDGDRDDVSPNGPLHRSPKVFLCGWDDATRHGLLHNETFGPMSLLIALDSSTDVSDAASHFHGSLTSTLHHEPDDASQANRWLVVAERFAGRIISNGWPTGMEIGWATQHGGPFPASLDGRSTSVGFHSMSRFVRPVCFQGFDESPIGTQ